MKVFRIVLVLIFFAVGTRAQSGQAAPGLNMKDVRGRPVRLTDYNGKIVLLNFWATWCPPCRTEIPELIKLQTQYRRQGLRIIGVTYPPESLADVLGFAKKAGMNYPIAVGTKEAKSLFTTSETLPVTVVIDRQGTIHDVVEGIMYSDEFDEKVKPLLVSKPTVSRHRLKSAAVQAGTIVVNGGGYQPSSVSLRRGVAAQLTFIRKVEQSCGREIVIPAYGINRALPLNTPVTVTFTPRRSGRFKFTCGMDMFRGTLVVK